MNILMVSSESVPFSKSGGLADVVGALTPELIKKGHDARIIIPAYNTKPENAGKKVCTLSIDLLDEKTEIEIRLQKVGKTKYYMVCHPMYCDRAGIYGDTSFEPYPDNFKRFTVLCKSAVELCRTTGFKPDIFHCHDWTAGLLPYFLKETRDKFFMGSKTVFTIHNLAYQGTFPRLSFLLSGNKPADNLFDGTSVNMLKAGLIYSDYITTVSPTYAKEIQTPEQGCGLEDILVRRKNRLKGIVNGIDTKEWNPSRDVHLPVHFSASSQKNKKQLKEEVQRRFGLPVKPDVPLIAMISRLASQKGFDALLACLENMLNELDVQFVIIGTGDKRLENALLEISARHENLSANIMFSNSAAHLVEAGSDFFLMPSLYEPCGLNQLYSLRYGTIPIVRRTGGLADTVKDIEENPENGTGLLFDELTPENITTSVKRAVNCYKQKNFSKIRTRAMQQDFSWSVSADEYIKVFEKLKGN